MLSATQQDRKDRTRRLILAGGLVAKAGLIELEANILLGLLLEAQDNLADPQNERRWKRRGAAAFEDTNK